MRLIGTAGHIDHGKSTLVQALTGIHPSHLPEEHAREMTIDLGYAYLEHPNGYKLGVVDVPGHERLVRNMVAGATGFELALWVVDARESVMPQSREHLHILDLLGVRCLVPVLTKADLASEEQIATACEEIGSLLHSVRARVESLHVVDSLSGRGIAELQRSIFALCREREDSDHDAPPYLPIDRAFSLRGIGTVVTGTLMRGRLAEGDHVSISSAPGAWRIRSLNNHHAPVREIGPGHRVGVNLAGLEADAVRRGDTLVSRDYPYTARFFNVRVEPVHGATLEWKHGLRMLFHAGATETECRVWGLVDEGEALWAQVELPREMDFFPRQRFILRGTNPRVTVGGGEVLDLSPDRPRRVTPAERSAYSLRERGEPWFAAYLAGGDRGVYRTTALARRWMVRESELIREALESPELAVGPEGAREEAGSLVWRSADGQALLTRLRDYVAGQPRNEKFLPFAKLGRELGLRLPDMHAWLQRLYEQENDAAASLRADTRLDRTGMVLYPGEVAFSAEERRIARRIVGRLKAEGLRPARIQDLHRQHASEPEIVERVLAKLRALGKIVLVSPDFALHPIAEAHLRSAPALQGLDGVSAAEFGRALGLSRKYSIPFLEYLNEKDVLRRSGDRHYLR